MKHILLTILAISMLALAGCSGNSNGDETVYTIGWVGPLSGDASIYGQPLQAMTKQAVEDVNAEWEGKRLEVKYEDGKCSGKDALSATQKLVNLEGITLISGGGCSGETLGMAPFANEQQIVVFSSLSSSPDITNAGDYIFRNYPSDSAQVAAMVPFITERGINTVALLVENTDYAQALARGYNEQLPDQGVEILAEEVVNSESRDMRTEIEKIKATGADAILVLPQSIPVGVAMMEQITEAGYGGMIFGNDVFALPESIALAPGSFEGTFGPQAIFAGEDDELFAAKAEQGACDLGQYCAAQYDAIFLLKDAIDSCNGTEPECIKAYLYNVRDWTGPFAGTITIDENGDVAGEFRVVTITNGEIVEA